MKDALAILIRFFSIKKLTTKKRIKKKRFFFMKHEAQKGIYERRSFVKMTVSVHFYFVLGTPRLALAYYLKQKYILVPLIVFIFY